MRVLAAVLALALAIGHAHGRNLTTLPQYNIDLNRLTVGGLSSGGYFAVQLHVAYSSIFRGAAIFAGGPYGCAVEGVVPATTFCMKGPIPDAAIDATVANTRLVADTGLIDHVSNLKEDKVYLYSGTHDTVVVPEVVKALQNFYEHFITPSAGGNITTQYSVPSEHCQPTLDYGNDCAYKGAPFIGKCDYDGAGMAFYAMYGSALKPKGNMVPSNLMQFSQADYFEVPPETFGLNTKGYYYVPSACKDGSVPCGVHFEFHGCEQSVDYLGEDFVIHAGYNDWAESNNIIVLYPQTHNIPVDNPKGCWDWYGYTGETFLYHDGVQIDFCKRLLDSLRQ